MKNFQIFLNYLLFFLLPTQLGHYFFIKSSYINGVRIDYLAPALYLTDIVIVALSIINVNTIVKKLHNKWTFVIFSISLCNIFLSIDPLISFYKWLKVFEVIVVFILIQQNKFELKRVYQILLLSTVLELLLSLLQITHQGSIQSVFYFLGERYFTISTPGIAKVALNGFEILRPYGTFSHPNSLAGYFLVLYTLILFKKDASVGYLKYILLSITALLVLFSFSKISILTFGIINILYAFVITRKQCMFCMISRIVVYVVLSSVFFMFQGDPYSITKRWELTQNAVEIILKNPFTGIGLGTYLVAQSKFPILYPYFFLQPVHNIYLLFISELGIPFSIIFFIFISYYLRQNKKNLAFIMVIIAIGITGLFDHYWLTLEQNMLLVPVILGFLKRRNVIK
jgi:hypothetical protein